MKHTLSWALLLFVLCSFEKNQEKADFYDLMGAHTDAWQFIETHEDYDLIYFFKNLWDRNRTPPFRGKKEPLPQVIHWIWLGPRPFPKQSIKNVRSWIKHHPGWKVKFWTDRVQKLPHPSMELCLISDLQFDYIDPFFRASDNYGEKSNLLRYEILYREGGLYVDHDVQCMRPFHFLHDSFDLYCALKPLQRPVLSSSVVVNNNLIGCAPRHPILKKTMENVRAKWEKVHRLYPGRDRDSIIYKVMHSSFVPFHDALKAAPLDAPQTYIALPAAYFNLIDPRHAPYANHLSEMTWVESATAFEHGVRSQISCLSKLQNQLFFFACLIVTAILCLFVCLTCQYRTIKQSGKRKKG